MLVKSKAIVLSVVRYNDEHLIADTFTDNAGRISYLVRLSRSPRATVRHVLFRPLALLEIDWDRRAGVSLPRPRSARVCIPYASLPYDGRKSAIGLFMADFLRHALRTEVDAAAVFSYVADSLQWLDTCTAGYANFHLVFLMRFARFLGFAPNMSAYHPGDYFDLEAGVFTTRQPLHAHFVGPSEAHSLPLLMRMNYGTMHLFRFTGRERSRLLEHINAYYRLHVDGFPELKSLAVLREMFAPTDPADGRKTAAVAPEKGTGGPAET